MRKICQIHCLLRVSVGDYLGFYFTCNSPAQVTARQPSRIYEPSVFTFTQRARLDRNRIFFLFLQETDLDLESSQRRNLQEKYSLKRPSKTSSFVTKSCMAEEICVEEACGAGYDHSAKKFPYAVNYTRSVTDAETIFTFKVSALTKIEHILSLTLIVFSIWAPAQSLSAFGAQIV